MATLGERLKREREVRGVSLSEISQATNIHSKHLSALEEDDFDTLPGPVFVTGFLRAYAHHLGLDADKLVNEYESLKTGREPQPTPHPPVDVDNGRFSVATIIVVFAIAFAGFMLYLGWSGKKPEEPVRAVGQPGEIKKLAPPENRAEKTTVSPAKMQSRAHLAKQGADELNVLPRTTKKSFPASGDSSRIAAGSFKESAPPEEFTDTPEIETPEQKDKPEQTAVIADVPAPEPESPPPTITKAVKEPMKTKYRLVISAKDEDVWISVEVDDETTHDMFVRAGRSIALRADKSITLTSGNAKSMELTLNGKPLDFKTTPNIIREWSLPLPE